MSHPTPSETASPLLSVRNLKVSFPIRSGLFRREVDSFDAVAGVSFDIAPGTTLGLVGESGCGKSTTGRALLRLNRSSGEIVFDGRDLATASPDDIRALRRQMQMIHQDPYGSLNPRMTVARAIAEPIRVHRLRPDEASISERVNELLTLVGLTQGHGERYPHELSGGQRQRVGIARALAIEPKFLICDEPVSALDVSVQAQVINLLDDLQDQLGLTYLFIAHGLAVVKHISDRVAVMYLGRIVELADSAVLYRSALHPYTRSLLSAVPIPDPKVEKSRKRILLKGDVPSAMAPPSGCRFHTRCPLAIAKCSLEEPPLADHGGGHFAACWRAGEPMPGEQPQAELEDA
jgi:oligopeptide transport system ATP-binding protein